MKRIYSITNPNVPARHNLNSNNASNDTAFGLFRWQKKKSKYLALASDNIVNIYNRHGEHVDQINLFGYCISMEWNEDGDWLAIITNRSTIILLWNSITFKLEQIESGMKESLTIISWSLIRTSLLFIGTIKGNQLLYNNQTYRKNPIYSKHLNKSIISCCWTDPIASSSSAPSTPSASTNLFALLSEDHVLMVNNEDGETLTLTTLKGDGTMVKFFVSYNDNSSGGNNTSKELKKSNQSDHQQQQRHLQSQQNSVAVVLNKKMLFMMNLNNSENSFILNFKDWYENILNYYCYPKGNIFLIFTSGLIVTISTNSKNFGLELFQIKAHKDSLNCFSISNTISKIATCDENNIKIFDLYDHTDIENVFTVDDEQSIVSMEWTSDGQLLAMLTTSGLIHVYLSSLKILGDNYGTNLAFLSSLMEVTIFNVHEESMTQDSVMIIRIEIEPSKLAIGPFHLAVSMNNKVWLYSLTGGGTNGGSINGSDELNEMNPLINELEYSGIVKDLKLNSNYMAILFTNGTLQFHPIEQLNPNHQNQNDNFNYFTFPDGSELQQQQQDNINNNQKKNFIGKSNKNFVTNLCLTNEFLIYSLENGSIQYFIIDDWKSTTIYRHKQSIKLLNSNLNGTRLIFIDRLSETFIYNVYNDVLIKIPIEFLPIKPHKILWDSWINEHDNYYGTNNLCCCFILIDQKFIYVYSSPENTIYGNDAVDDNNNNNNNSKVEFIGKMKIPNGQYPLLLYNGVVVCQTKSGKTSNFILSTHDYNIKNPSSISHHNSSKNRNRKMSSKKKNPDYRNPKFPIETFNNIIKLRRYQDAIKICTFLDDNNEDLDDDIDDDDTLGGGGGKYFWKKLAKFAIKDLEIDIAIRCYRQLRKYTQVYCLEKYRHEEEYPLLCGLLSEIIEEYDLAQKHFLNSSKPQLALEMRKNLQHWNEALALAKHLSPNDIPLICIELAKYQEFSQEYQKALENFEFALNELEKSTLNGQKKEENHIEICQAGIARNSIRCLNLKKAIEMSSKLTNLKLIEECAKIFESFNNLQESALLYEKCNNYDKAALIYLKIGGKSNLQKLSKLIAKLDNGEILRKYARIKEQEKQYRNAIEIYSKAKLWNDVVRINLDYLNNPGEAVRIVRETQSIDGAKLVARFFQNLNDMTAAIEFLIMSKCYDDAYNLALTTNQMDIYSDLMEYHYKENFNNNNKSETDEIKQEEEEEKFLNDFRTIAIYYEQLNNYYKAGKFFCLAKQYKKGIKLLLESIKQYEKNGMKSIEQQQQQESGQEPEQESDSSDSFEHKTLNMIIDYAAKINDEQINRILLDFLLGENDDNSSVNNGVGIGGGIPKDFKYLFRFYMKLKHFNEAAKTAIIIAREEQNQGNYRNAHQLLFSMCLELKKNFLIIPMEIIMNLIMVHSYLLAKIWIRIGEHSISSKLLIRCYENISQFPSHSVQILTFIVIECLRAGYQKNALKYAYILMRPENRNRIEPKLKKKIENLVRKSTVKTGQQRRHQQEQQQQNGNLNHNDHNHLNDNENEDDSLELLKELNYNTQPCPYCGELVRENEFSCTSCRASIPFCISTGMNIYLEHDNGGLTKCPQCQFPAMKSSFIELLTKSKTTTTDQSMICPMCEQEISDLNNLETIENLDQIFNLYH